MNIEKTKQLLQKYFNGETTLDEEDQLRNCFRQAENEELSKELVPYHQHFTFLNEAAMEEPRAEFDAFAKIESENSHAADIQPRDTDGEQLMNQKLVWSLRIAAGIILLLIGLSAGLIINANGASDARVAALQQEIKQMKNVLVYGSDSNLTASERISAVNVSSRLPENATSLDSEITEVLIHTMNNDPNVNVREAAAQALFRFQDEPRIRKALVHSLNRQNDPLMQITLINMLVELKETSAINEMQKMLLDSDTRPVVKTRLEVGIAELKT